MWLSILLPVLGFYFWQCQRSVRESSTIVAIEIDGQRALITGDKGVHRELSMVMLWVICQQSSAAKWFMWCHYGWGGTMRWGFRWAMAFGGVCLLLLVFMFCAVCDDCGKLISEFCLIFSLFCASCADFVQGMNGEVTLVESVCHRNLWWSYFLGIIRNTRQCSPEWRDVWKCCQYYYISK